MSYSEKYYRKIFDEVLKVINLEASEISPMIWIAWKVSIKRMFNEGILIQEIVDALPESLEKKKWSLSTKFFHRVRDVALKNRRESRGVKIDTGMQNMGELLKKVSVQKINNGV